MLYDVRLRIAYRYYQPAAASRTVLRMAPREMAGQQTLNSRIDITPNPNYRLPGQDFFGNPTVEVAHDMRLDEIEFVFQGRIQRDTVDTSLDLSCSVADIGGELGGLRSISPASPHHFLGVSPRIAADPDIAAFARATATPQMSTLDAVRAISRAIHDTFDFDPDATHVATTPLEAFQARRGVCQDYSHVMISALRALGIPAAYVSGFLRTEPPEGQPRLEGADAMHAWVRAWCGMENGWIEIDPTNNVLVSADHITVAFGRDYSDVAPVKGSLRSSGDQDTLHTVDVVPVS
ncbi:transglutaminase family protein [Phaeobacter sp. J2-8]|uniref:transglutaminase family protein n=1 Tax=Phaeobacter sp. J2-8 TaxID=2931394 RepID=UPI001FD0F4DE|nr:transglutaminase family protein [Phaeobacter sp. J2-8]MCJ7873124.1 transglutaminase family protein [Phaeobacter sp. J2-8]